MGFCASCFEKQQTINRLKEENESLRDKLEYQVKKGKQGFFAKSTPSSQKPYKENSKCGKPQKNGGARKGHQGNGRKVFAEQEISRIEQVEPFKKCPECNNRSLQNKGEKERFIVDIVPVKPERIVFISQKQWCPCCNKTFINKPPVLPRSYYGNQFLSEAVVEHYVNGVTAGKLADKYGELVSEGGLHDFFHRIAGIFESSMSGLVMDYRKAHVKHADETGWRTDGNNGYAWLFCSEKTSIYDFTNTRSAQIAGNILGNNMLKGVLVVDRYGGYNKAPCLLQYCYAHLLRDVEKLGEEFVSDFEVQSFVDASAPLLAEAMKLRAMNISDAAYYKRAKALKKRILKVIYSTAVHAGIRKIQSIFKDNKNRLFHWVNDRRIPADNNAAEREIRFTVIARKVSFGSQSAKGARTRSVLMSVLQTARKRLEDKSDAALKQWLKDALNKISNNPNCNIYSLFPAPAT